MGLGETMGKRICPRCITPHQLLLNTALIVHFHPNQACRPCGCHGSPPSRSFAPSTLHPSAIGGTSKRLQFACTICPFRAKKVDLHMDMVPLLAMVRMEKPSLSPSIWAKDMERMSNQKSSRYNWTGIVNSHKRKMEALECPLLTPDSANGFHRNNFDFHRLVGSLRTLLGIGILFLLECRMGC